MIICIYIHREWSAGECGITDNQSLNVKGEKYGILPNRLLVMAYTEIFCMPFPYIWAQYILSFKKWSTKKKALWFAW